jgi:putative transposase
MVTPAAKRKAVAHLMDAHGMSERRACKAIGCCRMTMRYETTGADDAGLRQRMKAIAQERRRFGYRRLHVLLKREGYLINHKKLFRLYREEILGEKRILIEDRVSFVCIDRDATDPHVCPHNGHSATTRPQLD